MKVTQIPFNSTGFFSKTMLHYIEQKDEIQPFYGNFSDINGLKNQIKIKEKSFNLANRNVLVAALKKQYKGLVTSQKTTDNIQLLSKETTFTITTGHQLNLFTGPLYFLYKIISTINLCEEISAKEPTKNFVPIYWMATEDHDFNEINYFNFKGKKVQWSREDGGAVGRFSTKGLEEVFDVLSSHLGNSKNATYLKELFSNAYLKHNTLAEATRFIANQLFSTYGLVVVDGDDAGLKQLFTPFVKDELVNQTSFKAVSKTIAALEKNYKIQVNPREINLFYLGENFRERIIFEDEIYKVNNTNITFTKEEILKEATENPLKFSPNVIMRPLYQEVILPNLCYIGGGGEIAYWLQLKHYFTKVNIPFPVLLLRNSVQIISEKQQVKLTKLAITSEEIFNKQHTLISKKVLENTALEIDFNALIKALEKQFSELKSVAVKTDVSFKNAVNAQESKQVKGLENLKKRLLKAEKRRQNDLVVRIEKIQDKLLPNQSLEERQRNFSEHYLAFGTHFIPSLKSALNPLALEFTVIVL